jgi:hypothetical protein
VAYNEKKNDVIRMQNNVAISHFFYTTTKKETHKIIMTWLERKIKMLFLVSSHNDKRKTHKKGSVTWSESKTKLFFHVSSLTDK